MQDLVDPGAFNPLFCHHRPCFGFQCALVSRAHIKAVIAPDHFSNLARGAQSLGGAAESITHSSAHRGTVTVTVSDIAFMFLKINRGPQCRMRLPRECGWLVGFS